MRDAKGEVPVSTYIISLFRGEHPWPRKPTASRILQSSAAITPIAFCPEVTTPSVSAGSIPPSAPVNPYTSSAWASTPSTSSRATVKNEYNITPRPGQLPRQPLRAQRPGRQADHRLERTRRHQPEIHRRPVRHRRRPDRRNPKPGVHVLPVQGTGRDPAGRTVLSDPA